MDDTSQKSLLKDILPYAKNSEELYRFINDHSLKSKYSMNLEDSNERADIAHICDRLFLQSDGKPADMETVAPEYLANMLYYKICTEQAKSIAGEVVKNDTLGTDYYTTIFLKLVENYRDIISTMDQKVEESVLNHAKDILFADRLDAFSRYDTWELSDPENDDLKHSPDRALISLLNHDLCIGAFWDDSVSLKNEMLKNQLQIQINILQEKGIDGVLGSDTKSVKRLIEIAKGEVSELSAFSFDCDWGRIDQVALDLEKRIDGIGKIKEFVNEIKPEGKKSLQDLVAELSKVKELKIK